MVFSPEEAFDLCLERARELMGVEKFNSWLANASFREFNNNVFTIGLDSDIRVNFVSQHYKSKLEELMREITDNDSIRLVFTDKPVTLNLGRFSSGLSARDQLFDNYLYPEYVFSRFISGPTNELAHASAVAVAHNLGHSTQNPLFIYGGVGLGKTHLVQAIAHYVRDNKPGESFAYISSSQFTSDYIRALDPSSSFEHSSARQMEKFKDRFRKCDYLIMEDVQFLAGKDGTQEQFFQIFNELYLMGKQIVLTSDRHPNEIEPLEERLVSRFQSGMLADIKPPKFETRKAILHQKLRDENIRLESGIVDYIAENITSNVRQLEGVVNILAANMRIQNIQPTIENVKTLVKEFLGSASRRLNPASITSVTADVFGVNKEALKGKKRKREILVPRQVAMFLIRDMTNLPLEEIGDYFGRDHSTVVNSIKRVKILMDQDVSFKRQVEEVKRSLDN